MKLTKKGYTLVEILVASAVFMLIMLGFVRLITFQGQMLARSRTQQVLQHQASYTLRHIRKYVAGATTVNLEAGPADADGRRSVSKIELIGRDGTQMAEYELIGSVLSYEGETIADKVDGLFTRWPETQGLRKFDLEVVTGDEVAGEEMTLRLVAPLIAPKVGPSGNYIYTWKDLYNVRNDMSAEYVMGNDLDKDSPYYAEYGADFDPIGQGSGGSYDQFTGVFDGQGYVIRDLVINKPNDSMIGLFSALGCDGTIKNLGLEEGNITGSGYGVGGLVASNYGTIINCYNANSVESTGSHVGGLVGINDYGAITDSHNTGSVEGDSLHIGGLVGFNWEGTITNSYNTGSVSVLGSASEVGGIAGGNLGEIRDCYNEGDVGEEGDDIKKVGGITGYTAGHVRGVIINCHNTGNIYGTDNVGGVVGQNQFGRIENSHNKGGNVTGQENVGGVVGYIYGGVTYNSNNTYCENAENVGSVTGVDNVGGVAGRNSTCPLYPDKPGTIEGCHNEGSVNGSRDVGGVVGVNAGTIENSHNGNGQIIGGARTAGVVGWNQGTIENSRNEGGNVTGGNHVGGVAGWNQGTIGNSHNTYCDNTESVGSVAGNWYVGGVVGWHEGTIVGCSNGGTVVGGSRIGGVVGLNAWNSVKIRNCYNTGSVTVTNDAGFGGGVAGGNDSSQAIRNCYNTGRINGTSNIGGVVGSQNDNATIANCYNTGNVLGTGANVGGVIGQYYGTVTNCYFSDGPNNEIGIREMNEAHFYASDHAVYSGWETPPWVWPGGDFPKLESEE